MLGVDKSLSNKIGRQNFWQNWLDETQTEREQVRGKMSKNINRDNAISSFIKAKTTDLAEVWSIYTQNRVEQSESSAKTARLQKPRTLNFIESFNLNREYNVIMDIGCGSGNQYNQTKLEQLGFDYNGCDPFNQSYSDNLKVIEKCHNGGADIVTLNNVLNTVPEKDVRKNILEQAENALRDDGLLLMITYEGEKTKAEKDYEKEKGQKISELDPIKTRDGWQNRMKTEKYLDEVRDVLPNVEMVSNKGSKIIVASKDPELDIKNRFQSPRRKVKNG